MTNTYRTPAQNPVTNNDKACPECYKMMHFEPLGSITEEMHDKLGVGEVGEVIGAYSCRNFEGRCYNREGAVEAREKHVLKTLARQLINTAVEEAPEDAKHWAPHLTSRSEGIPIVYSREAQPESYHWVQLPRPKTGTIEYDSLVEITDVAIYRIDGLNVSFQLSDIKLDRTRADGYGEITVPLHIANKYPPRRGWWMSNH